MLWSTTLLALVEILSSLHCALRSSCAVDVCGSDSVVGIIVYTITLSRLWCAVVVM